VPDSRRILKRLAMQQFSGDFTPHARAGSQYCPRFVSRRI
jgi:hypothetical protein